MNILDRFFRGLSNLINGAERSFLDALSAIVPYFVPVIPAYLTYFHTQDLMGFPSQVAFTAAFVVEVLGITAIATAIRFWRYNMRYKDVTKKAPFTLAIGVYVFYLLVVIMVNVILEVEDGSRNNTIILAIALFSLLSVPSGVLISIRSQFGEMLEDRQNQRVARHAPRTEQVVYNSDIPFGEAREKLHKNCMQCGRDFVTTYPNKKTCSDACRQAMSRAKKRNVL